MTFNKPLRQLYQLSDLYVFKLYLSFDCCFTKASTTNANPIDKYGVN